MLGTRTDHEMRLFVSNGTVVQFTSREVLRLYQSWQLWVLIAFGFTIMSTGHPVTLPQFEEVGVRMAFWIIALLIYLAVSIPYGVTFDRVWQRTVATPIPLLVLTAPLMVFTSVLTVVILTAAFEPGRPLNSMITWQMLARNVFVAHVFETVALVWLIPALRVSRSDERSVMLAGRRIPITDIGRVKAAEHYLEVFLPTGVEIIRERMSTFLEQVSSEDGVQTHRSHWVSRYHARSIKGSMLEMDCGNSVPVARGRQKDVQQWLDRYPPQVTNCASASPEPQSASQ